MSIKSVKLDWVLVGSLPILLWCISDRWMFLPVHFWYDPWFYLGIFLDYEYLSSLRPDSYFITRLPSIIPHFFAYKFLTPYEAVIVTTFLKFYLCIIPLYWILWKITKNRLAALIPIFLLSFFPYFLSSIGWHYVDGLGIAYISLASAFFVAACTQENWKLWLFLAGFAQALMLFNYLFEAIFIVIQIGAFIIYSKIHTQRSLLTCFVFLVAGGLFCTACLSSFSYYYNGTILFFLPQIQAAIQLSSLTYCVSGKNSVWTAPFKEWFPTSTWLFLNSFTYFFSACYVFKDSKKFKVSLSLDNLMVLQFLSAGLVYIMMEFLGFNFLQSFFFANYLLPFCVLSLGLVLSKNLPVLKYENWVIGGILLAFCIVFAFKGNAAAIGKSWGCVKVHFITCLLLGILFLKSSSKKKKILYSSLAVLLIALSFNRLTTNKNSYPYKDHSDHELVVKLHRYIKDNLPSQNSYMFWFNVQTDELGGFFLPLAATYINTGAASTLFSNTFPEIYEEGFLEKTKSTVILLSSDPDAIKKGEEALKKKGYDWDILRQEKFSLGEKQFLLLAFLLKPMEVKNEN